MTELHIDMDIFGDLIEMSAGDSGFISQIIDKFVENSNSSLAKIGNILKSGLYDELNISIHTFKGMSSQIGAAKLAKLCYQMERNIVSGSTKDLHQLLIDIRREYQAVRISIDSRGQQRQCNGAAPGITHSGL